MIGVVLFCVCDGEPAMVQGRPNDPRELSRTPEQIRRRLRRKGKKFDEDLEMYNEVMSRKPVAEWDLEELAKGRPRNAAGNFAGKAPGWLTIHVQREAKRRLVQHTLEGMSAHVDLAVKVIGNLLDSDEVDDKGKPIVDARTRFSAAQFVIENILGKPKALIEIATGEEVKSAVAAAIVLDDGEPQDSHRVIEGELADDEDEEEYDNDDSE